MCRRDKGTKGVSSGEGRTVCQGQRERSAAERDGLRTVKSSERERQQRSYSSSMGVIWRSDLRTLNELFRLRLLLDGRIIGRGGLGTDDRPVGSHDMSNRGGSWRRTPTGMRRSPQSSSSSKSKRS